MKILITTCLPTHGSGSGILITTQAKSYTDAGHKVTIITSNNRTNFERLESVSYHVVPFTSDSLEPEIIAGQLPFNYPAFTTHVESQITNFWNLSLEQFEEYYDAQKKAITEEVEAFNPDIIHAQHNWVMSSIATDFGKPVVCTIHGTDLLAYNRTIAELERVLDLISEKGDSSDEMAKIIAALEEIYRGYSSKKQITKTIEQCLENIDTTKETIVELITLFDDKTKLEQYVQHSKKCAKNSDKIIVISEEQKQEFTRLFPEEKDKIELVPNGYDNSIFHKEEGIDREKILQSLLPNEDISHDSLILFVGKFADCKGIDAFLCAIKLYEQELANIGKKAMTIIVGSGNLEESLKKQAELLELQNTHFVGKRLHDTIVPLQNLADVSLVTSRSEAFGLVVIEGTACGHPVIATNVGGLPDILNVSKEEIPENEHCFISPLGILIPALPKRPPHLETEHIELDTTATRYLISGDEEKSGVLHSASKKLNMEPKSLQTYLASYATTVEALSAAVQKVVTKAVKFDSNSIARHTEDTYAADAIRNRLFEVFDAARTSSEQKVKAKK